MALTVFCGSPASVRHERITSPSPSAGAFVAAIAGTAHTKPKAAAKVLANRDANILPPDRDEGSPSPALDACAAIV